MISKKNSSSPPYVLVVEDKIFSRLHAVDLVEAAGLSAIEACNADEAIGILETRKDIRIVFTDIDMPGSMDGLKLARAIRERWPPIELILTSGHVDVTDKTAQWKTNRSRACSPSGQNKYRNHHSGTCIEQRREPPRVGFIWVLLDCHTK